MHCIVIAIYLLLQKMFLYMEPRTISAIISRILNEDTLLCRQHLRLDYYSFITIVQHIPKKHHGWSVELDVVCFLYWMACGCSYRVVGGFMGFSRYTTRDIVYKMMDVVIGMSQLISHGSANNVGRALNVCILLITIKCSIR